MSMQGKLVKRGGRLFVLYETTSSSQPEITRLWWAVQHVKGSPYGPGVPEVGDTLGYTGEGWWSVTGRSAGSVWTGSGNTEAEFREELPAPPPKVRKGIELRWKYGQWEKLLKTGWVPAGMGKLPAPTATSSVPACPTHGLCGERLEPAVGGGKRRHQAAVHPAELKRLAKQVTLENFEAGITPEEAAYCREKSFSPGNFWLVQNRGRSRIGVEGHTAYRPGGGKRRMTGSAQTEFYVIFRADGAHLYRNLDGQEIKGWWPKKPTRVMTYSSHDASRPPIADEAWTWLENGEHAWSPYEPVKKQGLHKPYYVRAGGKRRQEPAKAHGRPARIGKLAAELNRLTR